MRWIVVPPWPSTSPTKLYRPSCSGMVVAGAGRRDRRCSMRGGHGYLGGRRRMDDGGVGSGRIPVPEVSECRHAILGSVTAATCDRGAAGVPAAHPRDDRRRLPPRAEAHLAPRGTVLRLPVGRLGEEQPKCELLLGGLGRGAFGGASLHRRKGRRKGGVGRKGGHERPRVGQSGTAAPAAVCGDVGDQSHRPSLHTHHLALATRRGALWGQLHDQRALITFRLPRRRPPSARHPGAGRGWLPACIAMHKTVGRRWHEARHKRGDGEHERFALGPPGLPRSSPIASCVTVAPALGPAGAARRAQLVFSTEARGIGHPCLGALNIGNCCENKRGTVGGLSALQCHVAVAQHLLMKCVCISPSLPSVQFDTVVRRTTSAEVV